MISNAVRGSEAPSSVLAQYEALRRAALGGVLPLEARCGLTLFLRRGMWGWIRTMAIGSAGVSQQPSCARPLGGPASDEYKAIIHVFAAMTMKADNQGARP